MNPDNFASYEFVQPVRSNRYFTSTLLIIVGLLAIAIVLGLVPVIHSPFDDAYTAQAMIIEVSPMDDLNNATHPVHVTYQFDILRSEYSHATYTGEGVITHYVPVGSTMSVSYNSTNPSLSTLQDVNSTGDYLWSLLSPIVLLAGVLTLVWGLIECEYDMTRFLSGLKKSLEAARR